MELELKEINPNVQFFCSTDAVTLNFQEFDFIIACGHPNQINFSEINSLSRKSFKCNCLCFEYGKKFFLFNDFGEFTMITPNGPKLLTFPPFKNEVNCDINFPQRNSSVQSFYEAIKGKTLLYYSLTSI